jgi:hypothetical protein
MCSHALLATTTIEAGFFVAICEFVMSVVKTICVAVAECVSHTKNEFYMELRKSLDLCVKAANLSVSHCIKQDDLSMDKPPKIYTYPAISGLCSGVAFVASSISRATEATYRQDRWQVRHGKRSVRSYRSMPWPILHNKSCKTMVIRDNGEYIEVTLKLLNGQYTVRLAGGSNYRDQLRGLRQAMNCGGIGDSKIWTDRKGKAIIGFCVKLPNIQKERNGEAVIVSGLDYLASMSMPRQNIPFVVNGDDIKQWKEESTRRNQQWRQARKQGVNKHRLRQQSSAFADKMNRRLKSKTHEMACQLVSKADRMNIKTIRLDLTIKSFAPSFPWYDFASKIKHKAAMFGIEVIEQTQSVAEPDCENPHIYFAYDPHSHRVKIGKTKGGKGRLESYWTSNPDWVLLAVDNQSQSKLGQKEKYYHSMFDAHRVVGRDKIGNELFAADPVIAWLRAVQWLGNAGNLSQIMQILDVSDDASRVGHLKADSKYSETLLSTEVLA